MVREIEVISPAKIGPMIAAAVAAAPGVAAAAEAAVGNAIAGRSLPESLSEDAAGWKFAVAHENREVAFGVRDDGSYYPAPPLSATAVASAGLLTSNQLVDTEWAFAVAFADNGEVTYGVRRDGTTYPAVVDSTNPDDAGVAVLLPYTFIGDSIAEGWGAGLAALIAQLGGRSINQYGKGGQGSAMVAARSGGIPVQLTLQDNTLLATGPTNVTAYSLNPMGYPAASTHTMKGWLAGVAVTLTVVISGTYPSLTAALTVARDATGPAVFVAPGTPLVVSERRERGLVIIAGRNDFGNGNFFSNNSVTTTGDRIQSILDWSKVPAKCLVTSVLPNNVNERIGAAGRAKWEEVNTALKARFGRNWVDWASWLQSPAAFASIGLTPTATDTTDMAQGVTPASFTSDGLHLTPAGYNASVALFARHITARDSI